MPGKKIAFVTYETPFAPCGGIAAVMNYLPRHMKSLCGNNTDTVLFTPFHYRIEKTYQLESQMSSRGTVNVLLKDRSISVDILEYVDPTSKLSWFFLKSQDKEFFTGYPHPYFTVENKIENKRNLLRDTMIFGHAVVEAIHRIDDQSQWILLAQDWEGAMTAMAANQRNLDLQIFLTLHNSYDKEIFKDILERFNYPSQSSRADSVLKCAIPSMQTPIFSVSEQFAHDLTHDTFQVKVFARHLQELLETMLQGIDNGPFETLKVDQTVLKSAITGDFNALKKWKQDNRQTSLLALEKLVPSEEKPLWGNIAQFKQHLASYPDSCWFVMAGRDDPRQKGYDVAALAVRRFLENRGKGQFIFFPIPGDEGLKGLDFLKSLGQNYPEQVLVFPFIWREGYAATLRGSTYGLMPSLYEPFGAANEFYLNGTVGIGRATGGLVQQIVPLRSASSFSRAVLKQVERWHTLSAAPTGLLFRERDEIPSAGEDWSGINDARYDHPGSMADRVEQRKQFPVFQEMVQELLLAFNDAVRLYQEHPSLYFSMITNGIYHIRNSFSWEKAAAEYLRCILPNNH